MGVENQNAIGCSEPVVRGWKVIHGLKRLKTLLKEMAMKVFSLWVDAENGWLGGDDSHRALGVEHDLLQSHIIAKSLIAYLKAHQVFERSRLLINCLPADARIGFTEAVGMGELEHSTVIGFNHDRMFIACHPAAYFKQPTTPIFAAGRRGEQVLASCPFDEAVSLT